MGDGNDAKEEMVTDGPNFASPPKPLFSGPSDGSDGSDAKKHQLSNAMTEAEGGKNGQWEDNL